MRNAKSIVFCLLCWSILAGCRSLSNSTPGTIATSPLNQAITTPLVVVQDPIFQSNGGGEPRTAGYWLSWNSCAEGNQAAVAQSNGGRESGWVILDDLLTDPGILVGELSLENCSQGVNLLQARDLTGSDHSTDLVYSLAAQLLTAQLNLAAGAEYCPASDTAVQAAQLLLVSLGFNGSRSVLEASASSQDVETAMILIEQLASYNIGLLCR